MLHSNFRPLVDVKLPFQGRQIYMHSFEIQKPHFPAGYEDYWWPVINLVRAAGLEKGTVHMTVDEKVLLPGGTHRRPGPHVDGCFMPTQQAWGHGGGGWKHNCNNVEAAYPGRMPVIVAASVQGCRVWKGEFDTEPKEDGDLSHLSLGEGEILLPNRGYLLSPDCVHESMPMLTETPRTFLRIALPPDFNHGL